jgi:hypothetical protein
VNRPKTRYAKTEDGVHIGYQVFGEGSNDLVIHLPLLPTSTPFGICPIGRRSSVPSEATRA